MERDFQFELPMTVFEKADAPAGKQRRIGGIVSLETQDRQDEVILQRGLDFRDFKSNGWFNDNHTKDTTGIVGYPEAIRMFRRGETLPDGRAAPATGHWVEGYLLEGFKKADEIWELGRALQKTDRRLGFSVEGKVLKRAGPGMRTIAKALVRNVAITNCPVNADARMEILAKSLRSVESAEDLERALGAGGTSNVKPTGPQVGMSAGQLLIGQSLESQYQNPYKKKKKGPAKNMEEEKEEEGEAKKALTDSEAFGIIRRRFPKISAETAGRILDHVKRSRT